MSNPFQCLLGLLLCAIMAASPALAVQVTISDGCGTNAVGSGATLAADETGAVTVTGSTGAYAPLFGCDAQPPVKPACVLSASKTQLAPGGSTTLYAKCTSAPAAYFWVVPSDGPVAPTGGASTLTFPNAGAYTYTVSASNASGQGPSSNQLTILVGDDTTKPTCTVSASPVSLSQGGKSRLQATCNPAPALPANYTWTTPDAGAPTPPTGGSNAELTFLNPGTFTYRVQATNGVGTGPIAVAVVTVAQGITATKAFSPASTGVGATSVLTISLTNTSATTATGVSFTDTYPAGLVNTANAAAATTCPGGAASATNNGASLALSGASVPANGSCNVTVNVTSATPGSYANNTGSVTTANMGTAASASATLTTRPGPTITKGFGPATIGANASSYLQITLTNPGTTAITGAGFTDTYPSGVVNASPAGGTHSCPNGVLTAASGGTSVALSGATIPASGSCTVSVSVTSAAPGPYDNTIPAGGLTTSNAGPNTAAATARLTVNACSTTATTYDMAMPSPYTTSPDVVGNGAGWTASFSFSLPANTNVEFVPQRAGDYITYWFPSSARWNISQCKGDFSTPIGNCTQDGYSEYFYMPVTTINQPSACVLQPNTQYYLNIRINSCSHSNGWCGYHLYRRR